MSQAVTVRPYQSQAVTVRPYQRDAIERVIHEMYERFAEPLSLRRLAEVARFSPYHFHRLFAAATGLAPARFLAAIRLEEAKKLLLTGGHSITDICMAVGYSSLGTFSARFHQAVGVSPRDFRRLGQDRLLVPQVVVAASSGDPPQPGNGEASVHGQIDAEEWAGPIFVGLFPRCSPERAPVACTIMSAPGRFSMRVPRGSYHILATSCGLPTEPLDLLLPDRSAVRVAGHRSPLRLTGGSAFVRLRLRLPSILDPPVLLAAPALVAGSRDATVRGAADPRGVGRESA